MKPVTVIATSSANATGVSGPNVNFMLPELSAQLDKYNLIRDCLAGQEAVKAAGTKYLPIPNATGDKKTDDLRYEGYLSRALFYNVTANTAAGLVGQVFAAEPVSEFPDELDNMWEDVSGTNVSMVQQAKRALANNVAYGRGGLLTDFPKAKGDGTAWTREEVQQGLARPTIQFYSYDQAINWRYIRVGAVSKLALVVLVEEYAIKDDGFEISHGTEIRVLRLDSAGQYEVELWRRRDDNQTVDEWIPYQTFQPLDASGNRLNYIPFTFIGSQNNDSTVDRPPLYDLACINIAHYRNSADYEDSVYMVGQPTPYFAGLTKQWVDDVLKGVIQLGSRGAVPLPAGGTAGLIQANENGMVKEAMEHKEKQMVALGAQLVEAKEVARTLGEAKMEAASVASILSTCASNVSAAFEMALRWACEFYGVDGTDVIFRLSTDFAITKLSTGERTQLVQEWSGGLITFSEARAQLRQSGIATMDDDEAKAEIEGDAQSAVDLDGEYEVDADGKIMTDDAGMPIKKKAAAPVVEE